MNKVIELTNEFCDVLTEMERAGIHIDVAALDKLEKETQERIDTLQAEMQLMAQDALGDTPINMNSSEQLSTLIFSRKLKDKKRWSSELGFYPNQNKFEKLRIQRMTPVKKFIRVVQNETEVLYKTDKEVCSLCHGKGKILKEGKGKRQYKCIVCEGSGIEYISNGKVGGFRATPKKEYASTTGFNTSNDVIEELLKNPKLNNKARKFLTMLDEYRKLSSYMSVGIQGIRHNMIGSILHPNFNQAVTATGRLSSSNPNVQNFPRGDTFPIKKVFTSKWKDGIIVDGDMGQLEFRVAAILANDNKATEDIINGVDVHALSAQALGITRQQAKAETFAPLFGAARDWGLLKRYPAIGKWHKKLIDEAVRTKKVVLPTGRVYHFPNVKRTAYGCNQQTKVKNYPVQGFASADIVPSIIIELHNKLINYQSYICSTIHDSIIVDVHPEEKEEVIRIIYDTMNDGVGIMKRRFNIDINVPLVADVKVGTNAFDTTEIKFN